MKSLTAFVLLLSAPAFAHMHKHQVLKEFNEPGHLPTKKSHVIYQTLDEVIPPAKRMRLDHKKLKRHHKKTSLLDFVFPSAYAMGCAPAANAPVIVPTAEPSAAVVTPVASPSGVPVIVPSASPAPSPSAGLAPPPTGVDLRDRDTAVKSQVGPYCTAYGLAAAIENKLGDHVDLSERHIWSFYTQYSVDAAASAVPGKLITTEAMWPESNKNPFSGYLAAAKHKLVTITNVEDEAAAIAALNRGNPVYVGMAVPRDMADCRATIRPTTAITSGGHALEIAGYELDATVGGGGYWIIKQSWGADCGDKGYQYMPFSVCDLNRMYCDFFEVSQVL